MAAEVLVLNNIEQGAIWSQEVTLDPVVDLTGFTGKCEIRATPSIESRVVASPLVTLDADPTLGVFTLSLLPAETVLLPTPSSTTYSTATRYQYDVIFTETLDATNVIRVLNGSVSVSPQITRS